MGGKKKYEMFSAFLQNEAKIVYYSVLYLQLTYLKD